MKFRNLTRARTQEDAENRRTTTAASVVIYTTKHRHNGCARFPGGPFKEPALRI